MARKPVSETKVVVSTGAGAARPRRVTTAKARVTKTAAPAETAPVAVLETVSAVAVPAAQSSTEAIALLAYSYWESRGCQGGSPEEDWLRAEQEVRLRSHASRV